MKRFVYILGFVFLVFEFSCGQTDSVDQSHTRLNEDASCPEVTISHYNGKIHSSKTITYKIDFAGEFDKTNLRFDWKVKGGRIINGHRKQKVVIALPESFKSKSSRLRLMIYGLADICQQVYVGRTGSDLKPPKPELFDEFRQVGEEDFMKKISHLLTRLDSQKDSYGYIINYGSQEEIRKRESEFKTYFKVRNIDVSKIFFVNGGNDRSIRTRFWIVPAGADISSVS